MKSTLLRLFFLALTVAAASCGSPVTGSDRAVDGDMPRLDNAAPDSGAARGGGNLMGGN